MRVDKKRVGRLALVTGLLLLLPWLSMQVTDDVAWTLSDFAVAGALLFGAGLAYLWLASKLHHKAARAAVGAGVAIALILVWAELAVGIF